MTNPRRRELDRAVRAYKRAHPGITLDQARKAVAARAGRPQVSRAGSRVCLGHSSAAWALVFAQRAGMADLDGSGPERARLLAAASGPRPLLVDTDPPPTLRQTLAPLLLGDTSSPFIGQLPPATYPDGPPRDE
ncbi:hypothetical protein [Streptomyces nigrescens]|uniref:hypothetical protein n=1 Tax=Streptomyces nigrescens TaxID=1920 RepID=UPI0036F59DD8